MTDDLSYWLKDAAKILRANGTTTHAEKVEAAAAALDVEFQRRLVENVFSWALEDCNYLAVKDADTIIEQTRAGMTPEQAAVWRSDRPTSPAGSSSPS